MIPGCLTAIAVAAQKLSGIVAKTALKTGQLITAAWSPATTINSLFEVNLELHLFTSGGDIYKYTSSDFTYVGSLPGYNDYSSSVMNSAVTASLGTVFYTCDTNGNFFKSTDLGVTWNLFTITGWPSGSRVVSILNPDANTVIFIGAVGEYAQSTDGGLTFTYNGNLVTSLGGSSVSAVALIGQMVYVTDSSSRIRYTTYGSTTWSFPSTNTQTLIGNSTTYFAAIVRVGTTSAILAYYTLSGAVYAIKSTDSGLTWVKVTPTGLPTVVQSSTNKPRIVWVSEATPRFYLATCLPGNTVTKVYQSTDGVAFTAVNTYSTRGMYPRAAIEFGRKPFFAGTSGAIISGNTTQIGGLYTTYPSWGRQAVRGVTKCSYGFYWAIGVGGGLMRSANGEDWTYMANLYDGAVETEAPIPIQHLVAGANGDLLVVTGSSLGVPTFWKITTNNGALTNWGSVYARNNLTGLAAVTSASRVIKVVFTGTYYYLFYGPSSTSFSIYRSTDTITWTAVATTVPTQMVNQTAVDVSYSNNRFYITAGQYIAVGNSDCSKWSVVIAFAGFNLATNLRTFYDVRADIDDVIAITSSGNIAFSTDGGATWTGVDVYNQGITNPTSCWIGKVGTAKYYFIVSNSKVYWTKNPTVWNVNDSAPYYTANTAYNQNVFWTTSSGVNLPAFANPNVLEYRGPVPLGTNYPDTILTIYD